MASDNIDALLKIAAMEGDEEIELNDFEAFLLVKEIEDGDYRVWDWQVYWHYSKWSVEPMSKSEFDREFRKKFKRREKKYGERFYGRYYYKLNVPLEVSYNVKKENRPKYTEKQKQHKKKLDEKFKRKQNKLPPSSDGL